MTSVHGFCEDLCKKFFEIFNMNSPNNQTFRISTQKINTCHFCAQITFRGGKLDNPHALENLSFWKIFSFSTFQEPKQSIQTEKIYCMNGFVELRADSKLSTFLIQPVYN